jgi:hypothetical protein
MWPEIDLRSSIEWNNNSAPLSVVQMLDLLSELAWRANCKALSANQVPSLSGARLANDGRQTCRRSGQLRAAYKGASQIRTEADPNIPHPVSAKGPPPPPPPPPRPGKKRCRPIGRERVQFGSTCRACRGDSLRKTANCYPRFSIAPRDY